MSSFQMALPRFLSLLGPQRMFQNVQGSLWALNLGVEREFLKLVALWAQTGEKQWAEKE